MRRYIAYYIVRIVLIIALTSAILILIDNQVTDPTGQWLIVYYIVMIVASLVLLQDSLRDAKENVKVINDLESLIKYRAEKDRV